MKIEIGTHTPWGLADNVEEIKDGNGICWVDTPSHGGFYVPDELVDKMDPARVMWSLRWSGSKNWFEEDCCACFVVDAFPELFAADKVESAREMIPGFYPSQA